MKKILCLVLVAVMVACGVLAVSNGTKVDTLTTELTAANEKIAELETAAADTSAVDAVQADLDAANAKIAELEAAAVEAADAAELEALVAQYKPYYDAQVIVEYNDGVVMKDAVMEIYSMFEQSAAQYGIDLVAYGMDAQYKEMAAQQALEEAVVFQKAAELGLDQLDEETTTALTDEAKATFENYITTVSANFQGEGVTEEEVREQSIAYLESIGYSEQEVIDVMIETYVSEQVYNSVTGDVAITEEDVKAAYDALVAEQEASFADDGSYNDARNNGEMIVWNPEGYRAVKQVLIRFSEEQDTAYAELQSALSDLKDELAAAQTPAEETEEASEEEAAAETTEEATEETTEETAEVRTVEAIEADIAAVEADIEALFAELMPEAEEVIEKFNSGVAFADLIAEHNDDPGMNNEPTATNGYAVAANSTVWDPNFTAGAMGIESVGGISEPINGSYGIYIIYYESDIPAGPVAFETVSETIAATALEEKITQTYNDAVVAWLADAAPVYHIENLQG